MGGVNTAEVEAFGPLPPEVVDHDVIAAIAAGDHRSALVLCSERHGAGLGRLCLALVGANGEADELVQETLLDAYDAFGSFRGEGSVRAFLFAIARRKCARHVERRGRRESRLRLVPSPQGDAGADELLAERQRAERARRELDALRPSEREALVMRFVSGLSFREVGLACGVDEAAARKRVSRALARLRERVNSEE